MSRFLVLLSLIAVMVSAGRWYMAWQASAHASLVTAGQVAKKPKPAPEGTAPKTKQSPVPTNLVIQNAAASEQPNPEPLDIELRSSNVEPAPDSIKSYARKRPKKQKIEVHQKQWAQEAFHTD